MKTAGYLVGLAMEIEDVEPTKIWGHRHRCIKHVRPNRGGVLQCVGDYGNLLQIPSSKPT